MMQQCCSVQEEKNIDMLLVSYNSKHFLSQFWRNTLFIQAWKLLSSRVIETSKAHPAFFFVQDGLWRSLRSLLLAVQSLHTSEKRRERTDWWESKKCNESGLRKPMCDQRRKFWLHHLSYAYISTLSARRAQFTKQQPEDYICSRAVARKSFVFVHSSWWFHVYQRSSHRRTHHHSMCECGDLPSW